MKHLIRSSILAGLAAAALAAPGAAFGIGATVEGFYGIARPPSTSLHDALTATSRPHLFKDSLQIAGGDVLFNLGGLELGAIADINWADKSASQTAIGALAGLRLPLGPARLDLLGEAGGHRYGNLAKNPDILTASKKEQWLMYLGLRPGVAFKVGGPGPGLLVGLWAYARWDLTSKNVPVTVAGGANGSYKLGGPSVGATVRVGVDF